MSLTLAQKQAKETVDTAYPSALYESGEFTREHTREFTREHTREFTREHTQMTDDDRWEASRIAAFLESECGGKTHHHSR